MHYLLNHMINFDQTCIDALLEGEELIVKCQIMTKIGFLYDNSLELNNAF